MDKLHFDILYLIFGFLDFPLKIIFRCISKYTHLLEIHDFYDIEDKYLRLLNDKILLNYPFIKYLNASNNINITNVNHMNKLIKLNASGYCGVNNKGIENIKLIQYLIIRGNINISNINHMSKLIKLDTNGKHFILLMVKNNCINFKMLNK
jgi:hypothetical protein